MLTTVACAAWEDALKKEGALRGTPELLLSWALIAVRIIMNVKRLCCSQRLATSQEATLVTYL